MAVCEIFSVKEWCDLETGLGFVQGHWKWHHLINCIRVSMRDSDLLVENREIFIPHLYLAPPQCAGLVETKPFHW